MAEHTPTEDELVEAWSDRRDFIAQITRTERPSDEESAAEARRTLDKIRADERAKAVCDEASVHAEAVRLVHELCASSTLSTNEALEALGVMEELRRLRDERAKGPDLPCDGWCNVNDGPQEECSKHGRTPSDLWSIIEGLNQRLAAERAKRPDREQIARRLYEFRLGRHVVDETWVRVREDWGTWVATCFRDADAVLSSFALEPEAREEPVADEWCRKESCRYRHWRSGSMPTHKRGSECPPPSAPEAREVTDAERAAALAAVLKLVEMHPRTVWDAIVNTALEASREVSRGS